MKHILKKIEKTSDCEALPPKRVPNVSSDLCIPSDLIEFYTLCGGVKCYKHSNYTMDIVSPENFVLANPQILPDNWKEYVDNNDRSNYWYVIATADSELSISIDLNKDRIGRCYGSFWQVHAVPSDSAIVALSFTDLIENIFTNKGGYWFWLQDEFKSLGDAYD